MRCDWKFDRLLFKCVCCFNTDVTFYDFCNTKIRITVTHQGTRVVKYSWRAYRQGTNTCQIHRRMTIRAIEGREVRFGQYFTRYREFMSLNYCMRLLWYSCVIVFDFYTHIMVLQRRYVTFILWLSSTKKLFYINTMLPCESKTITWQCLLIE